MKRTLQFAFLFSCVIHLAIVVQNPRYLFFVPRSRSQKIEVNYLKTSKVNKANLKRNSPPLRNEPRNPPPFIDRKTIAKSDIQAIPKELPFGLPTLIKPDITAIKKKKINLPRVAMGKISNPSYLSYYQVVREKIRRSAYQNYKRNETGETYITFIVSSTGYLEDVRIVEERSRASSYLKDIASTSVQNASPFPNFPKDLDYSQLSFNIIISFEIE